VITIQKTKKRSSQKNEQRQQPRIFIMFRSRRNVTDHYPLKEQYHRYNHRQKKQQRRLYHLSYRFNAETFRTRSLCNSVLWIDWGTPFEIVTIDEIAASAISQDKQEDSIRLICKRCLLSLAPLFKDQERAEISHIHNEDKKEKSH
jgi:hypothetical protein